MYCQHLEKTKFPKKRGSRSSFQPYRESWRSGGKLLVDETCLNEEDRKALKEPTQQKYTKKEIIVWIGEMPE